MRELQPEQFDIGGLVVARTAKQDAENARRLLEHRAGIANDEGAQCSTQDDDTLERLPQHFEVAAHGHVATEHAANDDDNTDYEPHTRKAPHQNRGSFCGPNRTIRTLTNSLLRDPSAPLRMHQRLDGAQSGTRSTALWYGRG
jgi:hypothetical protein